MMRSEKEIKKEIDELTEEIEGHRHRDGSACPCLNCVYNRRRIGTMRWVLERTEEE